MTTQHKMTFPFLAIGALFIASASDADAKPLRAKLTSAKIDTEYVLPGGPVHFAPASPCCGERCIRYQHHRALLRKPCCSSETIQTVLHVKAPSSCCYVDVPVCIPCCCNDAPKISTRRGLLGRSVVTYRWCCGYTIRMVFHRCGDITVHYHGV